MTGTKSPRSIESLVFYRIKRWGAGTVVLPNHFLDIGSREAVGIALFRLVKDGKLRRLSRGIYDLPRTDPLLGELSPTIEAVTKAITRRDQMKLQPSGAYALNLLGLSEQVPAKIVFLTEGKTRKLTIGPMTIELRQTTPRNMATAGRLSGLLIQAFRALKKEHVTSERIAKLKKTLPLSERQKLLKDLALAPAWMHPIFRELAESPTTDRRRK